MIECGWCGQPAGERCGNCGRDPQVPWVQRALAAPLVRTDATGRPALDRREVARRLADARRQLGPTATIESIADVLEVSPRTVRRWRQMAVDDREMAGSRPVTAPAPARGYEP